MNYASSSVLITGASRGIGREIAVAFASRTERPLILIARNEMNLLETKNLCEDAGAIQAKIIVCDLTDEKQTASLTLPEEIPAPGILVNNAGSFLLSPLQETGYTDFMNQIQSNLFSAVNITNRFLEELIALDRGLIINICSTSSLVGLKDSGAYAASKHALLGYTRSLRKELMDTNVGMTAINLGQTESTSWEGSGIDRSRLINPEDVARLVVALTQLSRRTLAEEILLQPRHGRVPPM